VGASRAPAGDPGASGGGAAGLGERGGGHGGDEGALGAAPCKELLELVAEPAQAVFRGVLED
jgi:hypothetical protein